MKYTLTLLIALLLSPLTAIHAAEITPNRLSPEETQRFGAAAEYSRAAHGGSRQDFRCAGKSAETPIEFTC